MCQPARPASCWCARPAPTRAAISSRGYLKDEAATEEAWAGGWFHTGDMVRRDADGSLYFVDRKKNVIRRSGENISAVEVESVLNQHPAVKAVGGGGGARRGARRRGAGLRRAARPGRRGRSAQRSRRAIVEHALAQLAYYKAPGYVAFVDALPLTAVAEDPARRSCASWRARCRASRTASTRAR